MGKLDDAARVVVTSASEWRAWLAEHAEHSSGVWLLMPKDASSARGDLYAPVVEEALCFGWIDGQAGADEHHSRIWMTPRQPQSAWAASNRERVERLVADGRMTPAGQRLIDAAKANGMWDVLRGPEAGVEPDELRRALDAEPAARAAWDAFPPSTRKAALTQVALARTPATVTRRITAIVTASAAGRRPA